MLGIHCPTDECFTPLVRNKNGQMFCVNCNRFAITAEEAKKQEEKQTQEEFDQQQLEAAKAAQEELERRQKSIEQVWQAEQQQKTTMNVSTGPVKRKSDQVPLASSDQEDSVQVCRRRTLTALYQVPNPSADH